MREDFANINTTELKNGFTDQLQLPWNLQLSNVTHTLNAQGIVETYTNVIPQYVLLHFTYRFASKPKKK